MERLFRSVMQVGGLPEADDAQANWRRFQEHVLEFETIEDKKIYDYLNTFYQQMASPPDFTLVQEYFEKQDDVETVARLDEIKSAQVYIRTNYLSIVRSIQDQQQIKSLILVCRDAGAIAEHGRNLEKPINGKKTLRGVTDAVNYLFDKMHSYTRVEGGEKLEGVVSDDADEVLEEYEVVESTDQYAGRNLWGLEPVDSVCKGHRKGEYWVHCAFAGELKTTVALNYAYNNVMVYGKNIFYSILEMPYTQLRRNLYVIHSSHGKFVTQWHGEDGYIGLDYRQVRDGELSKRDKERFRIVSRDFEASSKGKLFVWRPAEDVTINDIRRKAEMFHNKYGCDGIVIDHLGLVVPERRTNDYVVSLNSVVRDARLMALNFARGTAVPVLALFQLNRQGKLRADKNDGRYDFAAISYANEIEKSADEVTYTYLNDELRRAGKFYLGCLKNRDNPVFERMIGKILWRTKRIRALETGLIDFDTDQLVRAASQISAELGLDMKSMIA
jgi:replicative DNA helicase